MLKKIILTLVIQLIIAGIIIANPTLIDFCCENFGIKYEYKVNKIAYNWTAYNEDIISMEAQFYTLSSDIKMNNKYDYLNIDICGDYDGWMDVGDYVGTISLKLPINDAKKFYNEFPDDNKNVTKKYIDFSYEDGFTIGIYDLDNDTKLEFDGSPAYVTVVIKGFLNHFKFDGLYVNGEKITDIK